MSVSLAERLKVLKPSATFAVNQKAVEYRAQGRDVIALGLGEPDFDTPQHIQDAAIAAIRSGKTHYTAIDGVTELKQAIVDKFKRENNLDYNLKEVMACTGGKQCFFDAIQALLNPGDEIIIPAPYWVSYPDIALLAGAKPVFVESGIEQDFIMTAEQLEAAITEKTRCLVLNSPSNPTSMEYSAEDYRAYAEVLQRHPNIVIISDEVYEHLRWSDKPYCNILNVCPELKSRTMLLNAVSKTFAMTGWRLGFIAGPEEIIAGMRKVQAQSTSNPCSISQYAAIAALNGGLACVQPMVDAFAKRSKMVSDAVNAMPGLKCLPSFAALYVFPDVSVAMQNLNLATDAEFANWLIDQAEVAVVPGSAFGAPGYVRISIATADDLLQEAMRRMHKALSEI